MGPTLTAVEHAARLFEDPDVRTKVRVWLDEGLPFLEMIERLGFSHLVDDQLRFAIEALSPDEVAIISAAYIDEIERVGNAAKATPPVNCTLTALDGPVRVRAEVLDGRRVVRVESIADGS